MKKVVTALAICGILIASAQQSHAGDREWATAGKVLTGVIAGAVIARSFEPAPVVYAPAPVVYQQAPVVYQPAPTVVYQSAPVVVHPRAYHGRPVYVQAAPVCVPPPRVVVCPPPVHCGPSPVISHHYSFGHRPPHRVCW